MNIQQLLTKIKNFLRNQQNIARKIFIYYFSSLLIASILLYLPISQTNKMAPISYIDALFTACSVFSLTGFTLNNLGQQFNLFGQIVLFILLHVGGIGFMSIRVGIYLLLKKRIGASQQRALTYERGDGQLVDTLKMIKSIIIFILLVELVIGLLITINIYFRYFNNPDYQFNSNFFKLLWQSLFLASSATNNAGVSIFSFDFALLAKDYFTLTLVMIAIIIGGIGFPILHELGTYIKNRRAGIHQRLSLFFKVSTLTYFAVLVLGFFGIILTEVTANNSFLLDNSQPLFDRIFSLFFTNISLRNAGFATFDLTQLAPSTKVLASTLMWIGASPSSTGGGIRTTTFFIIIFAIIKTVKGDEDLVVAKRKIPNKLVQKALLVGITSIMIILTYLIIFASDNTPIIDTLFDLVSAFGTSGLTMGTINQVGTIKKLLLVILMFIGQLGISITLLSFSKKKIGLTKFPEEEIPIS